MGSAILNMLICWLYTMKFINYYSWVSNKVMFIKQTNKNTLIQLQKSKDYQKGYDADLFLIQQAIFLLFFFFLFFYIIDRNRRCYLFVVIMGETNLDIIGVTSLCQILTLHSYILNLLGQRYLFFDVTIPANANHNVAEKETLSGVAICL